MPEIFDQNDDWVGALLSKEPNKSHLFTFFASQLQDCFCNTQKARWSIGDLKTATQVAVGVSGDFPSDMP